MNKDNLMLDDAETMLAQAEQEAEKESHAINEYFRIWKEGKEPPEDLKRYLLEVTDLAFCDSLEEFFQSYGMLAADGITPTEYGEAALGVAPPPTVGTLLEGPTDDRTDPEHEPARLTAAAWKEGNFYAVTITADPGDAAKAEKWIAKGYDEYLELRDHFHEQGYYITGESFQTEAQYYPGFLTYEGAVNEFKTADERHLEFKSFPLFSKTAKIRLHDSAVIAADTGAGKSSLAINFLNDLNDDYPVLYFNLEMDSLTILRRLVAIRTGITLDRIEGYQKDEHTEAAVNSALRAITSRKPLQVIRDVYNLEDTKKDGKILSGIESIIKESTEDREDPTIVIIDHSLLVKTNNRKINGRYERFTHISEELRRISRRYNIVLFILLQQNREGQQKPPENSSLKESGSWENDATQIIFLWFDPNIKRKKLIMTKNRSGEGGSFILNYEKKTQTYTEAKDQGGAAYDIHSLDTDPNVKQTKRDKMREKLRTAYEDVVAKTGEGNVTLKDLAEVLDVRTATVKGYLKEYGDFTIDGEAVDPAGIDTVVESSGFIRLTPGEETEVPFDDPDDIIG